MIYAYDGTSMQQGFNCNGDHLNQAYDIDGNILSNALKVMTYNVGEWYIGGGKNVPANEDQLFYDMQNGMIATHSPDVLFIQEYWKVFSKTGRTAISLLQQYFPYIHEEGGNSGYYGHCLCSKYPISDYTTHFYSNDAQRYYDSATITVGSNTISLVNTHLGLTVSDREVQISELTAFLRTLDRFICCGDYNTPTAYSDTPPAPSELSPLFNAGFHLANCSTLGFYITSSGRPSSTWRGWIDNICTSSNIDILSASVDETKIPLAVAGTIPKIDHMPFIATLLF